MGQRTYVCIMWSAYGIVSTAIWLSGHTLLLKFSFAFSRKCPILEVSAQHPDVISIVVEQYRKNQYGYCHQLPFHSTTRLYTYSKWPQYSYNDKSCLVSIAECKMHFVSWKLALEDVCYRVIRLSSAKLAIIYSGTVRSRQNKQVGLNNRRILFT